MIDPQILTDTAEMAARQAGALLRRRWLEPRQLSAKGFRDIVTDSDYASQQLIARTILERFPDHGFLAEEEDATLPQSGPVIWVVDPVDGTTNFSRQFPVLCISIGALVANRVIGGVVYDPLRDELFRATLGRGAYLNGQMLRVSAVDDLNEAIWAVDWARTRADRQRLFDSIQAFGHEVRSIRAIGAAALGLAWVAAGRIDIYLNYTLSTWDIAAGYLLITEAGGRLTCVDGTPWAPLMGSPGIMASNGQAHDLWRQRMVA